MAAEADKISHRPRRTNPVLCESGVRCGGHLQTAGVPRLYTKNTRDRGSVHRGKKMRPARSYPVSPALACRSPGASARSVSSGGDLKSPAAEPCSHCTGDGAYLSKDACQRPLRGSTQLDRQQRLCRRRRLCKRQPGGFRCTTAQARGRRAALHTLARAQSMASQSGPSSWSSSGPKAPNGSGSTTASTVLVSGATAAG